jgi:anti-anti-sigma regulatory factor
MAPMTKQIFTWIRVDPARPEALPESVRAALQNRLDDPLVLDLRAVTYANPAVIEALGTAVQQADDAHCEIWVDGAQPKVYKALQIAKLGRLRRLPPGVTSPPSGQPEEEPE